MPIEDVSILLVHSDVRVMQRHYAPFVKARQLPLEERVRATWKLPQFAGSAIPFQTKA